MSTSDDRPAFTGPERRSWNRLDMEPSTSLTLRAGDRRYDCRIENLSLSGMKLQVAGAPPAEGPVVLEHGAVGEFAGQAVWHRDGTLGIRFCDPESELERALLCVSLIVNADPAPEAPRR